MPLLKLLQSIPPSETCQYQNPSDTQELTVNCVWADVSLHHDYLELIKTKKRMFCVCEPGYSVLAIFTKCNIIEAETMFFIKAV